MAMARYPSLFSAPLRDSFSYSVDMGVRRTVAPTDAPRQTRRYKAQPEYFSLELLVAVADLFRWQSWVAMNAYHWFEMPIVDAAPGGSISCENYRVIRFTGDISVSVLTKEHLTATVTAEIAPGQVAI